jgi:hypothetical protein
MRGVDSGIFASIRASKLPNLNAGILMDKIKNNDHILESSFVHRCARYKRILVTEMW